jgi:prostaglandin-endoperoxide synthase 2
MTKIFKAKKLLVYLAPRYPWLWWLVNKFPTLKSHVNMLFINLQSECTPARPFPFSLYGPSKDGDPADYISWIGLSDRSYTGRHLPPAPASYMRSLPHDEKEVAALFRRDGPMTPCPKSSALFAFFAQWFTDSFLRTDPLDAQKNTSNHDIDLCQIYGLTAHDTAILRCKEKGCEGELDSQQIEGQEYPPFIFEKTHDQKLEIKPEYNSLSYVTNTASRFHQIVLTTAGDQQKSLLFLAGVDNANSTVFYSAINTIFLREHNRLVRVMRERYPSWDSNRLFETARNTNIVQLLKIIVEDYINHLSSAYFKLSLPEFGFAEKQNWYRTNRISAEFDLLYRWHPFVPDSVALGGENVPTAELRLNNEKLLKLGVEEVIHAAATQCAGRLTLKNTASFLEDADLAAVKKSRKWRLRSYNDYCRHFDMEPATSFEDLAGNTAYADALKKIYKNVGQVELLPGLFADKHNYAAVVGNKGGVVGNLMHWMVAADAFSQALTNPLLSKNTWGDESCKITAFSKVGLESINTTSSFNDIVRRNSAMGSRKATFAASQPPPGSYGMIRPLKTLLDLIDFYLISGWQQYFRRRQKKYNSTVFRANLFKPTIIALDHHAIEPLFTSADLVPDRPSHRFQFGGRQFGLPPLPLVGNVCPSMYEAGAKHDNFKKLYMRVLHERKDTLVPAFRRVADEFTSRWLSLNTFCWRDELEDFAVSVLFEWFLGTRPEPDKVRQLYNKIFKHYLAPVSRFIPGLAYWKSLAFYKRLLVFVKVSPGFRDIVAFARAEGLYDDEDTIAKQITYVIGMNSYLGIQNLLKSIVGELSLDPELCDKLRLEIMDEMEGELTSANFGKLEKLEQLDYTICEILRLHPPVFFISGRATRDWLLVSDSGKFLVGKGELVTGVIPLAHHDVSVFPRPEQFDPDRFKDKKARQHLIWPRGLHDGEICSSNRTCPGKNVAVLIAKLFCFEMLRKFTWQLKEVSVWEQHWFDLNVAAPKGALDVDKFRLRRQEAL